MSFPPYCPMPGRALALFVSLAAAALTVPVAAPPAAAADEPVVGTTVELRVGSYNIQANRTPTEFATAVITTLPRVDVIGLQEVNSRDKGDKLAAMKAFGWGSYRAKPGGQEPIVWRQSRFDLIGQRSVKLTDSFWIGKEKPGAPSRQRDKYVSVVRLHDKLADLDLSFINVHLVSGAVKNGVPRQDRPRLVDLYKRQMKALSDLTAAESAWGTTYVFGDYNVGYVADSKNRKRALPFRRFQSKGLASMWATGTPDQGGTRGVAFLDQIYAAQAPSSTAVAYDITLSDHFPAIATYDLAVAPAG